MNALASSVVRFLGRSPLTAALLYLCVVGALLTSSLLAFLEIGDHLRSVRQATEDLEQLRARDLRSAPVRQVNSAAMPFLGGETLTIAGALLLQRVNSAIVDAGGSIQSSQVDLATGAKDGSVSLIVSCDLQASALQKLLFDLETGMPLLLIDQIDVQAPQPAFGSDARNGSLKISLNITGQWRPEHKDSGVPLPASR